VDANSNRDDNSIINNNCIAVIITASVAARRADKRRGANKSGDRFSSFRPAVSIDAIFPQVLSIKCRGPFETATSPPRERKGLGWAAERRRTSDISVGQIFKLT
jgi:hypothetical protein